MKNNFGDFLKEKRQEKNLTQKDLANMLHVSESAISKWEKDVARPDISLLPKLSEILGVSEHELITASIDKQSRAEKVQAKKWRTLSFSWDLFFYIAYGLALLPCFICDLAINKSLTWFWIVFSALLLAFTFTNLPKLIKKHKLVFVPLSILLALIILLGVCCIYSRGNWFLIPAMSVILSWVIVFAPVFISKLKPFEKVRKFNDLISLGIDFIVLNILLIIVDCFSVNNHHASHHWYLTIALPIVCCIYFVINLCVCVKFLKLNRFIKSSLVLFIINFFCYGVPRLIKVDNADVMRELGETNPFTANFSNWSPTGGQIDRNIHCIIFLSLLFLSLTFLAIGLILHFKKKHNSKWLSIKFC